MIPPDKAATASPAQPQGATRGPRPFSNYSQRARIGVIVPPTNTVNEAEWLRMMPDGVTFHAARMPLHADTASEAGRKALDRKSVV